MKKKKKMPNAALPQALAGQNLSNKLLRRPFYSVARSAFIHIGVPAPDAANEGPEEAVRQWCAFELIRAYGFGINDLNFEAQAQVGSKTYRIDILVRRSGSPWIVVECKAPGSGSGKAIEQAISYAESPRIQAEYVLYTNGSDWLVRRRLKGQWQSVLDLPAARFDAAGSIDITHFFACFADVAPLLYKLDETIEGKEAGCFLHALQKFFHGWNLLTDGVDQELTDCADNLLRVMALPEAPTDYRRGKYECARRAFNRFRDTDEASGGIIPLGPEMHLRQGFQELQNAVLRAVNASEKWAGPDVLVLRVLAVLLDYGQQAELGKKPFPTVPTNVHHSLREFLQHQFATKFDATLPDPVEQLDSSDFKLYCHTAWEQALNAVEQL